MRFSLNIGEYHPLFIHFPITLITFLLAIDLLTIVIKIDYSKWNKLFCFINAAIFLFALFSVITGWYAAKSYAPDFYLVTHRALGFALLGVSFVAMLRRIGENWGGLPRLKWYNVFISCLLFVNMFLAADFGGVLTRGVSPFRKREDISLQNLDKDIDLDDF